VPRPPRHVCARCMTCCLQADSQTIRYVNAVSCMFGLLQGPAKTYTTGLRPSAEPQLSQGSKTGAAMGQVRDLLGVEVCVLTAPTARHHVCAAGQGTLTCPRSVGRMRLCTGCVFFIYMCSGSCAFWLWLGPDVHLHQLVLTCQVRIQLPRCCIGLSSLAHS
jgi:hypothetical protein